ncbi:MAG: endoflagellar protein [Aliifodinibius sp.]|nr:flagellar FlbD family protein [Fodinibius sp.]NIW47166.1 endoflagellar protein [Gammaproteobacteria bacterium]NIY28297.1 endoflagellar protein [Fodinibius sp.]
MITVTRINSQSITINAEIIEFVECTPDTIITTMTGKKIIVKESVDDVIQKVIAYRQSCFDNIKIELEKKML